MKKLKVIIFFVFISIWSVGQTRNDQAQILKKCIDLPELQSYLMTDSEGNIQQLWIYYWQPLSFSLD